jgi:hypothetical protein
MRACPTLRFGFIALTLISAAPCGCERKAPGPDECEHFAEMAARMSTDSPLLSPELQAQIDEETRQCLTKPYDRELLACVETTHQAHGCLASFRQRAGRSQ